MISPTCPPFRPKLFVFNFSQFSHFLILILCNCPGFDCLLLLKASEYFNDTEHAKENSAAFNELRNFDMITI